ncbi:MAG: DUF364 domain-containing protein [Dehalococcoidia bacterium]|nr:MAG: DUF364 domain-containing protein [Dehalococcoidia bacterium]
MKVLDDLISNLDNNFRVQEVYACVLWTAVMTQHWGMASSFRQEHPCHGRIRGVGQMRGKPSIELAEFALSDNLLEASIGMATINSLLDIDEAKCSNINAADILVEKGKDQNVAIVGHFPFTERLKKVAKKLWILEQKPRGEDLPAESAKDILPIVDVVGLTGTSLINHTFENIMKLCKDKFVVMVGPTSPLSPILFDYGVDVISGVKVIEAKRMLACISEGAMFKQIEGLKYLSMRK